MQKLHKQIRSYNSNRKAQKKRRPTKNTERSKKDLNKVYSHHTKCRTLLNRNCKIAKQKLTSEITKYKFGRETRLKVRVNHRLTILRNMTPFIFSFFNFINKNLNVFDHFTCSSSEVTNGINYKQRKYKITITKQLQKIKKLRKMSNTDKRAQRTGVK